MWTNRCLVGNEFVFTILTSLSKSPLAQHTSARLSYFVTWSSDNLMNSTPLSARRHLFEDRSFYDLFTSCRRGHLALMSETGLLQWRHQTRWYSRPFPEDVSSRRHRWRCSVPSQHLSLKLVGSRWPMLFCFIEELRFIKRWNPSDTKKLFWASKCIFQTSLCRESRENKYVQ